MNVWDFLILAVVAAAVFLAVRALRKNKGSCGCGCESCRSDCSACAAEQVCGKKKPAEKNLPAGGNNEPCS